LSHKRESRVASLDSIYNLNERDNEYSLELINCYTDFIYNMKVLDEMLHATFYIINNDDINKLGELYDDGMFTKTLKCQMINMTSSDTNLRTVLLSIINGDRVATEIINGITTKRDELIEDDLSYFCFMFNQLHWEKHDVDKFIEIFSKRSFEYLKLLCVEYEKINKVPLIEACNESLCDDNINVNTSTEGEVAPIDNKLTDNDAAATSMDGWQMLFKPLVIRLSRASSIIVAAVYNWYLIPVASITIVKAESSFDRLAQELDNVPAWVWWTGLGIVSICCISICLYRCCSQRQADDANFERHQWPDELELMKDLVETQHQNSLTGGYQTYAGMVTPQEINHPLMTVDITSIANEDDDCKNTGLVTELEEQTSGISKDDIVDIIQWWQTITTN